MQRTMGIVAVALLSLASFEISVAQNSQSPTYFEKAARLKEAGTTDLQTVYLAENWPILSDDYAGMGRAAKLIVMARCVDYRYRLSPDARRIYTVYRFEIEEAVKSLPLRPESPPASQGAAPTREGEFLVIVEGGMVKIDGIRFEEVSTDFAPFEVNQRYILFLKEFSSEESFGSQTLYQPVSGPYGCIQLQLKNGSEVARPHSGNEQLEERLAFRYGLRKADLIAGLRRDFGR